MAIDLGGWIVFLGSQVYSKPTHNVPSTSMIGITFFLIDLINFNQNKIVFFYLCRGSKDNEVELSISPFQ